MKDIYPEELALESDNAKLHTHYLDLDLEIFQDKISYKLFDKRDAFGFRIVNFPKFKRQHSNKIKLWDFRFAVNQIRTLLSTLEGFFTTCKSTD